MPFQPVIGVVGAPGHVPLDFQLFISFWSLQSCTTLTFDTMRLPIQYTGL